MAQRVIVNDGVVEADPDSTIRDILQWCGLQDAPSVVTNNGEVITPDQYDRAAPPHGMMTNSTPIKKGGFLPAPQARLRQRLLDAEFSLIANRFLRQFPGIPRTLELADNTLLFRGFPLPNDYTPDHIDLLIVIWGYPDVPPAGVHIPSDSPNLKQIATHLGGHVTAEIPSILKEHVEELADHGWHWVCYHFHNWTWKLNHKNLLAGDSLYKYVENVFAALSGGHRG